MTADAKTARCQFPGCGLTKEEHDDPSEFREFFGDEHEVTSKSEMKRVAILDPMRAADELDRLKAENKGLKNDLNTLEIAHTSVLIENGRLREALERIAKYNNGRDQWSSDIAADTLKATSGVE